MARDTVTEVEPNAYDRTREARLWAGTTELLNQQGQVWRPTQHITGLRSPALPTGGASVSNVPLCESAARKFLVVGEVFLECLGCDLGVALAELVHQ